MTRFYDVAEYVLDVVANALNPSQFKPKRVFVQPGGEVAWDDCCDGQLWVRVIDINPKVATNARSAVDPRCLVRGWQLRLGIGHLHCVSTLDDQGKAPSSSVLTGEASAVLSTAYAIQKTLLCHQELGELYRPNLGPWRPLGPTGACAGGEWTIEAEVRS